MVIEEIMIFAIYYKNKINYLKKQIHANLQTKTSRTLECDYLKKSL